MFSISEGRAEDNPGDTDFEKDFQLSCITFGALRREKGIGRVCGYQGPSHYSFGDGEQYAILQGAVAMYIWLRWILVKFISGS